MLKGFYHCDDGFMFVWDMTTNPDLIDRIPDAAIPLHEAKDFLGERGVRIDDAEYGITGFFGGASYNFCREMS